VDWVTSQPLLEKQRLPKNEKDCEYCGRKKGRHSGQVPHQGWTLALASSPRQGSKVLGEHKSLITRPFGEHNFVTKKLLKLQNKHHFLHAILPRKSLNINFPFLFYKVLYSKLSNTLVLKGNTGLCRLTNMASS